MFKLILPILFIALYSCKKDSTISEQTEQKEDEQTKELNILEKVASAYGIENWDDVEKVNFSFVVNPGEKESSRKWSWEPKTNLVTLHNGDEKSTYNRNKVSEKNIRTDKAFINDSFWLLFPFHLVWDDIDYEVVENFESPLNFEKSTRITITYPSEGGYTPGDKYNIFVNDDYHIIEWIYYPSGSDEPALINTFEDLTEFDGIKINMIHRNPASDFQLNFRDVSFE
jgi:hypothetical protein